MEILLQRTLDHQFPKSEESVSTAAMSTGGINEEQPPLVKCKDCDTKSVRCLPIPIVPKDEVLADKRAASIGK